MDVADLLKLGPAPCWSSTAASARAIDIYVNNAWWRAARSVLVEDKLGVTMTEIIKAERA